MALPSEVAAMRRAIALAAIGLGATSPNPPVGCVILDTQGRIVGEGYHQRKGEAHAETRALAAAGPLARAATAVVTLEPCNHHGRTPPCRQALIGAGISRVVIALIDPTSRGEGGATLLRAAGVDVETGVLADEARLILQDWLAALRTHRPVITWPYLATAAGIAALPAGMPESRMLRLNADAVLGDDGSVTEAIPGRHGTGILNLKDTAFAPDPRAFATSLYDGGVRRLLLDGGGETARPFLTAALVDRVLAYLPEKNTSSRPEENWPLPLVPPGFTITDVTRIEGFVRTIASKTELP